MNPKYQNIGHSRDKLIEEIGEVLQAIGKAERFGYFEGHPDDYKCRSKPKKEWCDWNGKKISSGGFMGHSCGTTKTNLDNIALELNDLNDAIHNMRIHLWRKIKYKRRITK